jgi:rubrerythrin
LECRIKNCLDHPAGGRCFQCSAFPCRRERTIEDRYVTRYRESLIGNLRRLQAVGMDRHLADEKARWTCGECGSTMSVHSLLCPVCGRPRVTVEGRSEANPS